MRKSKLLEHCTVEYTALTAHVDKVVMMDIEKTELAKELRMLSHLLSPECRSTQKKMNFYKWNISFRTLAYGRQVNMAINWA